MKNLYKNLCSLSENDEEELTNYLNRIFSDYFEMDIMKDGVVFTYLYEGELIGFTVFNTDEIEIYKTDNDKKMKVLSHIKKFIRTMKINKVLF